MNSSKKYIDLYYILPLILLSFYYSIDKFTLQSAVDGGLVLSQFVEFPKNFSNVTSIFFNGWTILHQFSFVLLKLNFSVNSISMIFTFIIIIFYALGIFYLTLGISKSRKLALILSLFVIITRESFGDVDYPVLFFSEHTYGAFSLASFTLLVGFLSNNNFKMAGVMSALLFATHLVVGVWVICLYIFCYIVSQLLFKDSNKINYKKIFLGISFLIIPLLLSFIFFRYNVIEKSFFHLSDFQIYLNQWDAHRNIFSINYDYIGKTFFLLTIIMIYIFYFRNKNNHIMFLFILISCVGSMIIYLLYKFLPNLFPLIVIRAMPTRLFLLHSVVGYPIIISILFCFSKKTKFYPNINFNYLKKFFLIIFIFSFLFLILGVGDLVKKTNQFYTNKIEKRFQKLTNTFTRQDKIDEDIFWKKIHDIELNGYFVTTFNSSGPTLRYGKKPYLINTSYFDHVPYHPYTATEVKLIIEDVYEIPFKSPPTKFLAVLIDDWFKETFEKRSILDWKMLSNKYNISGIIVPSDWNLQIQEKIISKKFTAYILN